MSDIGKTVVAIQGNPVKREILGTNQDGYVLTWTNDDGQWEAQPIGGTTPGEGDLSGMFPNQIVTSLTGNGGIVLFTELTLTTTNNAPIIQATIEDSITLSTDNINGGDNGPINIITGTAPTSESLSCHNISLDAGAQNGVSNGSIEIVTGYGNNTGQHITLDSYHANSDYYNSQLALTSEKIHINNTGLCYNSIYLVSANYTINNGRDNSYDYIILCDTTSGAFTVTLPPSPSVGDTYIIKDSSGNCGTNNLTINGNSNTIDGSSTYIINNNWGVITIIFNSSWLILNKV